ncbi:MAG: glycosyltransferase family 4 protein [Pyrinomonadaceae bacterium]|nr:glycosyltransferase family 4 protein [Pyrinomonadaceae bacterium]MCX7640786.1 glycosyltransferase family 4 protein [Pyrinomonadaceae bacterium]MDW8304625.1 glycosyltransferase family 4 protein [Acidobacteriota bacterium]
MNSKIKILIVAPSMRNFGGQSIQAKNLIDAFKNDETFDLELVENDPTTFLQIKYLRTLAKSVKFWLKLIKKIPKSDLVHVSSAAKSGYLVATIPPFIISKLFRKPVLLHYHSGELEEHIKKWKMTSLPVMRRFEQVVVPSEFLAKIFADFGIRAEIIANFVDLNKFKFRTRNPLRPFFLSNRNFEEHYNVADVLRAFQIISQKFPQAKLIVVGSGKKEQELKNLATELKLKEVEFVGKVTNEQMASYYDRADIYLNASLVDNMPVSLIESFACGLPVVSYATGGINFMIENRKTGILIPKGDYKALAKAAIELLEDNHLAQQIIENARIEAKRYEPVGIIKKWRKIYGQMLSLPTASSSEAKPF